MINLLIKLLKESVEKCYVNDKSLIERSMEQASVARIYYYMQYMINTEDEYAQFKSYNLDCEYYKNGNLLKELDSCPNGTRPDLILHKRGSNENNLLIVEFKSNNGTIHNDIVKLIGFTAEHNDYKYRLGIFVKLDNQPEYRYFQKGEEVNESVISNE